jgi:flagellar hook-basal body protein
LAISGDGFFPLKSADGLQDVYTRNGAFMLNDQFNVVNSAGQRLMAATVDSTGSANVNDRVVLTIPQTTVGEAKQTSLVQLGVNFPADAGVITDTFSRTNAASYNKSTALTVYDQGGNGYLATIYYVKTQNATATSPFNKWQTHVYIGDDEVKASLMQASDANKEPVYVNQYGVTKPYSLVKDFLTNNAKTQKFSLNQLTDKQVSVPASITGKTTIDLAAAGAMIDFKALANGVAAVAAVAAVVGPPAVAAIPAVVAVPAVSLANLFKVQIDGSSVNVDLTYLKDRAPMNGTQIAAEMTNYLNGKFGDERYYQLPAAVAPATGFGGDNFTLTVGSGALAYTKALNFGTTTTGLMTTAQIVVGMQKAIDDADTAQADVTKKLNLTVSYDAAGRTFKYVDKVVDANAAPRVISISATGGNALLGLTTIPAALAADGKMTNQIAPNSDTPIRALADQRFGIVVTYNTGNKDFTFSSGTTGDTSTIALSTLDNKNTTDATKFGLPATDASVINPLALSLFGVSTTAVAASTASVRGVVSTPAVAYGTSPSINMKNNFGVTADNNTFIVTVDDVSGTVTIPVNPDYSLDGFRKELEKQINLLADNTGKTVGGVKVAFDSVAQRFTFTTGTSNSNSFIKVTGKGPWGLEATQNGQGATSTWIRPTQSTDATGKLVYIDAQGQETTSGDGFVTAPKWTPIYLDKGELTFDTGGKLVSPLSGSQLETVFLQDGKGALTINIDYSKSTQYTSPFAVLSQTQDGAPEGDLVGVTIKNDGLVSASYSNGTQKSLAKILLVNFSNPTGLRQVGDSSFLTSAASGNPILGTAGSAGFGTIRAGATERSNVDLTAELVDLITAQRNFQANAKAIETSTTMTQAIINIRG